MKKIGKRQLAEVLWLAEVEGVEVTKACGQVGISRRTYYEHRRLRTPDWQEAEKIVQGALPKLQEAAERRARRILASGSDAAAVALIIRILGLSERQELRHEHSGPIPIAIVGDGELDEVAGSNTAGLGQTSPDTGSSETTGILDQ